VCEQLAPGHCMKMDRPGVEPTTSLPLAQRLNRHTTTVSLPFLLFLLSHGEEDVNWDIGLNRQMVELSSDLSGPFFSFTISNFSIRLANLVLAS